MPAKKDIHEAPLDSEKIKFIDALRAMPDSRDNRGKRHSWVFLVSSVVFAMCVGRSCVSSIHRYIVNKIQWLREVTGCKNATPISRAHLPRMLAALDWVALSDAISTCFSERTVRLIQEEWIAADGKVLRGSLKSGEKQAIIHAVSHKSRIDLAQARQVGDKSSEITVMRDFLKETGLEKQHITLDAHHCNPDTLTQVHKSKGLYLIQIKENQPLLLEQCRRLSEQSPRATDIKHDTGHGSVTTRRADLYDMQALPIDERWQHSGLQSLVVMNRETYSLLRHTSTHETAYYLSNVPQRHPLHTVETLASAIRGHWGVESNNWQLDVTFNEDHVRTKNANQAQIMGKLRCFVMNLLRWSKAGVHNLQAIIEKFADSPDDLLSTLRQVNFL